MANKTTKREIEVQFYRRLQQDQAIVPNMLIRHYQDIGLTAEDCLLLISIIGAFPAHQGYITYRQLVDYWRDEEVDVQSMIADFSKRKYLTKAKDLTIEDGYTLDGLYEQLYELYVYIHACPRHNQPVAVAEAAPQPTGKEQIKQVFALFEGELARPLSPTEAEQISKWLIADNWSGEMIKEALRRAVLHGTCNLIYIDKILVRWQKEGIVSFEQLAAEQQENANKTTKSKKKADKPAKIMENDTDYSDVFGY